MSRTMTHQQVLRVLLVEDEEDLRDLISAVLRDKGYDVVSAKDGHEAQTLIQRREAFDVMFTDVKMPNGVCGISLARSVAILSPRTKVILTSGLSPPQLPPFPSGVAFLQKPYRLKQLFSLLTEITSAE